MLFLFSLTAALADQLVCMLPSQVFHCHFNSNFFPLFLEHLLSDQISVSTGSFLLGESQVGLEGAARLGPGLSLDSLFPNSIWGEVCSHAGLRAVRFTHTHTPHASLGPLSRPSWAQKYLGAFSSDDKLNVLDSGLDFTEVLL